MRRDDGGGSTQKHIWWITTKHVRLTTLFRSLRLGTCSSTVNALWLQQHGNPSGVANTASFVPPALSQLLALSYCCLFLLAAAHSQLFALTHCSLFCLCRSLGAVALTRCCLFSLVASLTESCRSPEKDSYDQLLSLVHPLTCGSSSNTQLTEYEVR